MFQVWYLRVLKNLVLVFKGVEVTGWVFFYSPEIDIGGQIVFVLSVILSSSLKLILANNFWKLSARTLIFHMSIPCDRTFPLVP